MNLNSRTTVEGFSKKFPKMNAHPLTSTLPYSRGEGYLTFMGYLQIGAGTLTLLFSLCGIASGLASDSSLLIPFNGEGPYNGFFQSLISAYLAFQITFGWLLGLLQIGAGIKCLHFKGRSLACVASAANMLNFPHGTTVSIMMLHGLITRDISRAFHDQR